MNWRKEITAKAPKARGALAEAEPEVATADHEGDAAPSEALLAAVDKAVGPIIDEVARVRDDVCVTVEGHLTTEGEGFRPAHVVITISRVDSAGMAEQSAERLVGA